MALKIAWDNRSKTAFAIVLLVVAIYVVANWLWGGTVRVSLDSVPAVAQVTTPQKIHQGPIRKNNKLKFDIYKLDSQDPSIHFEFFATTENMKYTGGGRNIFAPPGTPDKPTGPDPGEPGIGVGPNTPAQPPGPPAPPPFPLRFYGYSLTPAGVRKVFFTDPDGQDIFIGMEGDLINKRYKISKINKSSVELLDVINHTSQNMPMVSN